MPNSPYSLPYIKFEGKTCLIRIGIRTLSVICWHQLIMHVFRPLFLTSSSQLHDFSLHFCYFLCAYAILHAFPDNSNSLLIQFIFHFPSDLNYQGCTVVQYLVDFRISVFDIRLNMTEYYHKYSVSLIEYSQYSVELTEYYQYSLSQLFMNTDIS